MNGWIWSSSTDGSSWYRCDLPSQALAWEGHRFPVCEILPHTQLMRADVVIGSRIATGKAVAAWHIMKARGARLVLDLDDDYWELDETNPAASFWTSTMRAGLANGVEMADVVTCASEELARRMRERFGGDVRYVPNGLPAQYLAAPRVYEDGPVTIGWAGTASTVPELDVPGVRRALARIVGPGVSVSVVGSVPEATGLNARHVEWANHGGQYLSRVSEFDVWVAPYRDTSFNRAKFPTKALEAGFLGIPLIASDIAPYRAWTEGRGPEETGVILVRHDHEWGRWVRLLASSPHWRAELGRAGRSWAARYALQGLGQTWAGVVG